MQWNCWRKWYNSTERILGILIHSLISFRLIKLKKFKTSSLQSKRKNRSLLSLTLSSHICMMALNRSTIFRLKSNAFGSISWITWTWGNCVRSSWLNLGFSRILKTTLCGNSFMSVTKLSSTAMKSLAMKFTTQCLDNVKSIRQLAFAQYSKLKLLLWQV